MSCQMNQSELVTQNQPGHVDSATVHDEIGAAAQRKTIQHQYVGGLGKHAVDHDITRDLIALGVGYAVIVTVRRYLYPVRRQFIGPIAATDR